MPGEAKMPVRKRWKKNAAGKKVFLGYQFSYTDPITKERKQPMLKGVKNKGEADEAAAELYARLCSAARRGESAGPSKSDAALDLETFLAYDLERAIRPSTRATESHQHKPLLNFFGRNCPMTSITLESLKQYQLRRPVKPKRDGTPGKPVANSTINDEISVLMAAMNRAKDEGRLWKVPDLPKKLPEKESRKRVLIPAQIERFFDELRKLYPDTADQAEVMYRLGGLRPCELWRMKWSDVDFEVGTITVESSKTGQGTELVYRVVPLSKELADILQRQPRRPNGLIFGKTPDERKGHCSTAKARGCKDGVVFLGDYRFAWKVKKAAVAAGLPNPDKVIPYALRHSAATNADGVDNNDIAYILGHKDATLTAKLYRHARNDKVFAGVGSLSKPCDTGVTRNKSSALIALSHMDEMDNDI